MNEPGASVPKALLVAAAERGLDLTDDNPRAAFDIEVSFLKSPVYQ
jgi:hypothetical protein